jgi:branched-chain amino acid transport system substrate-binding protein
MPVERLRASARRNRASRLHPKLMLAVVALTASLVLGATAAIAGTARSSGDPGVTSSSILLGGTAPLTGPSSAYAAVARGADAYFKYINARGGVFGRKIEYRVVDDAYTTAETVSLTHQLVEQDKVFAMFNSLGTAGNVAVRPWLNTMKVPQLFVASGATTWGRDYATYPYSSGFQPSYQAEGWVYGKYLARTAPGATIAVLFENDDYGKDLLGGLKRGLQRSKAKVIAAQPYDAGTADVSSQIAKLKASGADTLAIFATPNYAVQAYSIASKIGWKLKRVINNAAAAGAATMVKASDNGQNKLVGGTISIAFMRDPNDPQWKTDANVKLYRTILSRYAPGATGDDSLYVYGMAAAWTAVEALRRAGKDLTRGSLVKALDTFTAAGNPFLLPGIAVKTAGRDHFPIEQMLLQRWQGATWKSFGGLWSYRTF